MSWRATPALVRAVLAGLVGLALGVAFASPTAALAAVPLVLLGALGLLGRPTSTPTLATRVVRILLHSQSTRSWLEVSGDGVEHLTRAVEPRPHLVTDPPPGVVSLLVEPGSVHRHGLTIGARRWGRPVAGTETVSLTSSWGGYRWGPAQSPGQRLTVLPNPAAYDASTQVPDPVGLVGAHRSRRQGDGSEYAATRPFVTGDRLRRINWRVSARTRALHVDTALTEEDTGLLLLVDGLADHGISGGVDGAASSLDLTVRAAAAIATQHIRQGDRVSLRIVDERARTLRPGTGSRHLQRLLGLLAGVVPGEPARFAPDRLSLGVTGDTVVVVLSPMLSAAMGAVVATLARNDVRVLVVDTLPPGTTAAHQQGASPEIAALAWRMRLLERDAVVSRLGGHGVPVVAWRGPGTLDEVLRMLGRRGRAPRVRVR